jgi:hypothetical protein
LDMFMTTISSCLHLLLCINNPANNSFDHWHSCNSTNLSSNRMCQQRMLTKTSTTSVLNHVYCPSLNLWLGLYRYKAQQSKRTLPLNNSLVHANIHDIKLYPFSSSWIQPVWWVETCVDKHPHA